MDAGLKMYTAPASLPKVLAITGLLSLTTGVYWHGVSFIAKHGYHFDEPRTAILYVLMGALYAAAAFASGWLSRAVPLTLRGQLTVLTIAMGIAATLPALWPVEAALWVSAVAISVVSAVLWPQVESFLSRGRHGPKMRQAVAGFNLVWMLAVALPMLVVGAVLGHSATATFVGLAVITLPGLAMVRALPAQPPPHGHETQEVVPASYPHLLRSARLLLVMSYAFMAALSPLLPYRLEAIEVALMWATPATATWMFCRLLPGAILNRWPGWHGRFAPLGAGALAMFAGMTGILLVPSLGGLLVSFVVFGLGVGLIYHVALYYALAVGAAEVDAGSVHEGLIGVGYMGGPLLALVCGHVGGRGTLAAALGALVAVGLAVTAWTAARSRRAIPSGAGPVAMSSGR